MNTEVNGCTCLLIEKRKTFSGDEYWSCGRVGHMHMVESTARRCSEKRKNTGAFLSRDDAQFIVECLKWNRENYVERSAKYCEFGSNPIDGYREKVYEPTMAKFDRAIDLLRAIKNATR